MNAKISALVRADIAGSAPAARALESREARYAGVASIWREELAKMLRAQVTNLASTVHGFTALSARSGGGFRGPRLNFWAGGV
jgi:hypothetical protein